jgi:hypothetical protein
VNWWLTLFGLINIALAVGNLYVARKNRQVAQINEATARTNLATAAMLDRLQRLE